MALIGKSNEEKIWNYLKSKGLNDYGCAGLIGNLYCESGLLSNNLQNTSNKKLGMTDEEYCFAVDNGSYSKDKFIKDNSGFGIAQWTYSTRKSALYEYTKYKNKSIGDLETQLEFLYKELKESYSSVLTVLQTATSIRQASNIILFEYENPADQSISAQNKRASYGEKYYNKYSSKINKKTHSTGGGDMSEKELRKKVVEIAESFYGCKESDGSHKKIIDIYNNCKMQLPSGYRVSYNDAWCATYVSSVGIKAELSDIIFRECGCERMINLYKEAGRFVEDDSYVPKEADIIFYDWGDNGVRDNTGFSDHVGLVVSVNGDTIKVIEGNISNSVGYRTIKVNAKYIRGYGIPDYASKAGLSESTKINGNTSTNTSTSSSSTSSSTLKFKVGETINFIGNKHFISSNSTSSSSCKSGLAKITAISKKSKHPYHVIAVKGNGSTVYGWVDESDVISDTVKNNNDNIVIDYAQSFSKSYFGSYKATTNVNIRSGAGTSKKILAVIPKGSSVTCYGYYTVYNNVKWYYVTYKDDNGKNIIGFVSCEYLSK